MVRAAELPLRAWHGNIYVTTVLNGTPTNMVFDSGAMETVIDNDAASRLSLDLQPAGTSYGIGGLGERYAFVAKTFQIGTLRGRNLPLAATVMRMSHGGVPVDGLLGVDFLAAYDVDLDIPEHKAVLFAKVSGCSTPSAHLQQPLYAVPMITPQNPNDFRALVHVQIDGKQLTALIDSGAAHTVIFRNAARRLGLNLADLTTDRHVHLNGVGPRSPEAVRHVMTPIDVGDLSVRNVPAAIVDERSRDEVDMLLGLDFLVRVHVWYDFAARSLIMQFPPQASPP